MIGIYARQSLDKKDSLSIAMQIESCKEKYLYNCKAKGVEPDEIIIYKDAGYSGKNTKRPDFQRMLSDIKHKKINHVVIYKLDRLGRSIIDFSDLWSTFEKYGVSLSCSTQDIDTSSPMGKTMIFMLMVFAEMERNLIRERVMDNYYERVKDGRWGGGPAPYGLSNAKTKDSAGRSIPILVPNEKIEIMKMMFKMYANTDISLGKLAEYLNSKNIKCMKSDTWSNVSIAKLLRNPAYVRADCDVYAYISSFGISIANPIDDFTGVRAGNLVGKRGTLAGGDRIHKDFSEMVFALGAWEGTIESSLWLKANYKLDNNKQIGNNGKGTITWLTGLFKCGCCGYAFRTVVTSSAKSRRLYCSGKSERKKTCTNIVELRLEEVEHYVQEELEKVLEQCQDVVIDETPYMKNADKIELKKVEEEIDNLIKKIKDGSANDTLMYFINREIEALNTKRNEISERMFIPERKQVKMPKIKFNELGIVEKHLVAQNYIDKVLITGVEIEIKWKV
nr:recombinase family protein [uncultured Anaerocolumna sp.]